MDSMCGVFTAIIVTLLLFNVTVISGQGNTTLILTPLNNYHLTTSFRLDCRFVYGEGTAVVNIAHFYRKRQNDQNFAEIARVDIRQVNPIYNWNDTALRDRSTFDQINSTYVRIEVSGITCTDKAQYRCMYFLKDRENIDYQVFSEANQLDVTAPPGKPTLSYNPEVIMENEPVTFSCNGNVGLPAGTLEMFALKANGQEVNLNANNGLVQVELNGCTFLRSATASYNFTADDDARTNVHCRVQQPYANNNDHSTETELLGVNYTPRDTVMYSTVDSGGRQQITDGQTIEVPVQSDVLLQCQTSSNPAAMYEWSYSLLAGNNTETPTHIGQLHLDSIAQDKAGTYKCRAFNVIGNTTFTSGASFILNVSSIPTVPPTDPTSDPSTGTETDPSTTKAGEVSQPNQAGMIAGAVIGAVVGVIIVIIIIVLIMRKRKKDNKEPIGGKENKPRNNQDIPRVVVHPNQFTPEKYNDKYNKGFEKNEKELEYADLKFDDTPRSRKPVQILYEPTNYAEVAWPRV